MARTRRPAPSHKHGPMRKFTPVPFLRKVPPQKDPIISVQGGLMAKKTAAKKNRSKPGKPKGPSLEARVAELEGDLKRVVELLGATLGDPFKTQAQEIVAKQQGT